MSLRRAYADSAWGQLHYRIVRPEAPMRPPLLLLHQTPKSGWEYEPIMPLLGVDRVVVAPDTPGYGASDGPSAPVRIEDYAAAFHTLMADLAGRGIVGPEPFDVMGTHTGAISATAMADAEPDRVRRLVLVGLAAYDAEIRAAKLEGLKKYPGPQANLSHVEAIWKVMATLADPRATPAWRHRSLAENLISGERMPWGYQAVYGYDFQAALARLRQPVLVINPEDDLSHVTPTAAALIRNGRRVDLPGVKHGLFALDSEKIAGLVRDFLDG